MFLKTENPLIVLGALIVGGLLGEWWKIETRVQSLGIWLEKRITGGFEGSSNRFVRGFLSASLLFCTGPMAVLGSISDGLRGDYLTLSIKSILDGFVSIAFASTLGIGVAFSALPVFAYQGSISLLSTQLNSIMSNSMMNEMTKASASVTWKIFLTFDKSLRDAHLGSPHHPVRATDRDLDHIKP